MKPTQASALLELLVVSKCSDMVILETPHILKRSFIFHVELTIAADDAKGIIYKLY